MLQSAGVWRERLLRFFWRWHARGQHAGNALLPSGGEGRSRRRGRRPNRRLQGKRGATRRGGQGTSDGRAAGRRQAVRGRTSDSGWSGRDGVPDTAAEGGRAVLLSDAGGTGPRRPDAPRGDAGGGAC